MVNRGGRFAVYAAASLTLVLGTSGCAAQVDGSPTCAPADDAQSFKPAPTLPPPFPPAATTPTPGTPTSALGHPLRFSDEFGLSADVTLRNVTYTLHSCGSNGETPESGLFTVAQFSIADVSGSYDLGYLQYNYEESDSHIDGADIDGNFHPDLSLATDSLSPGDTALGYVAFDVALKGGTIQVSSAVNLFDTSGTHAQWAAPG